MDYNQLADAFLTMLFTLKKAETHKSIDESMRGARFVLRYLYQQKKPVLPSEICQYMKISSARVAATLNNLEKKELITRKIDPKDRRQILVELTPKGEKTSRGHEQAILHKTAHMLRALGEHDANELIRIVQKLTEHLVQKQSTLHHSSLTPHKHDSKGENHL